MVLGGSLAALFIFIKFFADKWLGPKIELRVKHEYDKRLEDHKANMEVQVKNAIMYMEASYRDSVDKKAADKALFRTFVDDLKYDGKLDFLKHHVAPHPIRTELFGLFRDFLVRWADAEHSFLDDEIEAKRKATLEHIREYMSYLAFNTWYFDGDYNSVPAEWKYEQQARYIETIRTIDQLADRAAKSYEEMIRVGKAKLNI